MVTNNHNGKTEENHITQNKKKFIENYPEFGSIGATLKAIGVKSRKTFYNWCDNDERFKEIYNNELLPNRRDELISKLWQVSTGRLGTHVKTITLKNGTTIEEEVPNEIPPTQLTGIFGFLKATDHKKDKYDELTFTEKQQVDLGVKGEIPIRVIYDNKP